MSQGPGNQAALVSLEKVTKRFPGVVANDAVSLKIAAGEVHVLLGENGAGKSTLISLLAGVAQPDEGRILVDGSPRRLESPRHALQLGIGTVYQHGTLVPSLTVLENLMLGMPWWRRRDRSEARARFLSVSDALGLNLPNDAVAGELSLGEQKLVELVKALWRGQRLLILDEATSMLTPEGADELGSMVGRLAKAGVAVLFVTHKLPEALAFGDRISVLREGQMVGTHSVPALRRRGENQAVGRILELMFGTSEGMAPPPSRDRDRSGQPVVLEVEQLSVAAGGASPAVQDVSFSIRAGEIFGIAGVEGNGQKQLAEALSGQRPIFSGSIRLEGERVEQSGVHQRQRRGLRYVTDDRLGEGTVGSLPVALNLLIKRIGEPPFWRWGLERPGRINDHAEDLIQRYRIRAPRPATPAAHLSGGNVQKLVLARELDSSPRAVVYNKPTHGLDVHSALAASAAIRHQADAGVASLLISTDLDELLTLCDRIGVMLSGRLVGVVDNDGDARRRVAELMVGRAAA